MKRFPVLLVAAGLLVIAAACTTSVTNSGPSSAAPSAALPTILASLGPASSAAPSLAPASASAASAGGDASAWCAIVIDINARAGYMVDKTYVSPPTAAMFKQVTLEALARKDEIMSVTPPEIHDVVAAELAYFQDLADWANQNGWDMSATIASTPPPPPDFLAGLDALNSFQMTQCGIKFE